MRFLGGLLDELARNVEQDCRKEARDILGEVLVEQACLILCLEQEVD